MREFGKTEYAKCAYSNFDNNARMQELFTGDLNIERLITGLQSETVTCNTIPGRPSERFYRIIAGKSG